MKLKLPGKKQTIIITALEIVLIVAAVFCILNIAHKRIEANKEANQEEKKITAEQQERMADLGSWNLILVNKWNKMPEDMVVETADIENGYSIDARVKDNLEAMMEACREAGCDPAICSAFRTHDVQQSLYDREAEPFLAQGMSEEEAYEKAGESVAIPGTSEHECGLAVDIIDSGYQVLDDKQEETETQKWLMANCQDYGFILRYPNDKKDVTGIIYEPWHYRYVGKNHARYIMEKGICLEEYINELKQGQSQ